MTLESTTTLEQPIAAVVSSDLLHGYWTQAEAIRLCVAVEAVCPTYGCHVALTGGTLYRQGKRKDCDLLFYRIRQKPEIDLAGLWAALEAIGLVKQSGWGWCYKATYHGKSVDCFIPEEQEVNPNGEPPSKYG